MKKRKSNPLPLTQKQKRMLREAREKTLNLVELEAANLTWKLYSRILKEFQK
jgi:hypothetical protein